MQLKTPEFWSSKGLIARALQPAAWLYGIMARRHLRKSAGVKVDKPVICVGNLTVGGTGKTPMALLLGQMLLAEGMRVHFLIRGYGGAAAAVPLQVDVSRHDFTKTGDEALLLATCSTCWVAADRVAGAQMAQAAGAEIIIMDDGFQNPSLHKDLSIVVVDGYYGFGNGMLLPAGPLRGRIEDGFARADAVVIVGKDRHGIAEILPPDMPLMRARIVPSGSLEWLKKEPLVAFAGIGRPQKFFAMLEEMGCDLREKIAFADHHKFTAAEMEKLVATAKSNKALLVTTQKDMVRISPEFHADIRSVAVEMKIDDMAVVKKLLNKLPPQTVDKGGR